MSKDKQHEQPKQEHEAPKQEQAKQSYFFPNVGEGKAFSVEAASYEEAVEANTKHLKEHK